MKLLRTWSLIMMFGLFSNSANALEVGDAMPAFSVNSTGGEVTSQSLAGSWVVLFFYPKADTSGCTKEACSIRDGYADLTGTGAKVFGVSLDGVDAQNKFKAKYNLPYELLADNEKVITKAFDNLALGGLVASRKTFIFNPGGKLASIIDKVDVKTHNDQVIAELKRLQGK